MILQALLASSVLLAQQQAPNKEQQAAALEKAIQENRYTLSAKGGKLAGTGADFLLNEAKNAQFVCLGENHFNKDIPEITTMLLRELQARYGFQYLAIESGTTVIQTLSEKPYRGNADKIFAYAKQYPYALTFNSDQEAQMIADVGAFSKAKGRPVWGLDQEFGAVPVLDDLRKRTTSEHAHEVIDRVRAKAFKYEAKRGDDHYMAGFAEAADFKELADAYDAKPGSYEAQAIAQLQKSQEIYEYYRRADKGEAVGYFNNYVREENMKDLFMREYRYAQSRGDKLPKAVLKFGQWHLYKGRGPASILTTGNFVTELAKSNGMDSLHVYFMVHNKKEEDARWNFVKPFLNASAEEGWTLYDLRPLRPLWYGSVIAPEAEMVRTLLGFDFLWILRDSPQGTFQKTMGESAGG